MKLLHFIERFFVFLKKNFTHWNLWQKRGKMGENYPQGAGKSMPILRLFVRIFCLPILILCYLIKWLSLAVIACGSNILSPVLWFIGVCCVYTIIKQQWDQTLLLLIIGAAGLFLFAGAITVAAIAQGVATVLLNL